jgi:hypothetical protein
LTGAVDDDVVSIHGLMLLSHDPVAQGNPLSFEANLSTGFVRLVAALDSVWEGTGVVARI